MISNLREEVGEHVPGEDHLDNGEEQASCLAVVHFLVVSINQTH